MNDELHEQDINLTEKNPMMENISTGEQTQITKKIKEISDSITGEGIVVAMRIYDHIKSMEVAEGATGPDFTRTADEIVKENKYNGCNEAGVVFASLLRAKGIPTTYIQALRKDSLQEYSDERPSLNGHVFLEADFGDMESKNIKIINSTTGEITDELPDDMLVGARGMDAWAIGLRNGFEDLQKMFEEKRRESTI
jgi:hypothetical protein